MNNQHQHGIKSELFFGLTDPTRGNPVNNESVRLFVCDVITSRFPGFTRTDTTGFWNGKPENSFVITIVHPGTADYMAKIEEIREYYKANFNQESVGLVNTVVYYDF